MDAVARPCGKSRFISLDMYVRTCSFYFMYIVLFYVLKMLVTCIVGHMLENWNTNAHRYINNSCCPIFFRTFSLVQVR